MASQVLRRRYWGALRSRYSCLGASGRAPNLSGSALSSATRYRPGMRYRRLEFSGNLQLQLRGLTSQKHSSGNTIASEAAKARTGESRHELEASRTWTLPNIITFARICSCPLLAGLVMTSEYKLALIGLGIASASDWLDGYLARRLDQKSVLGGFLDPLADKVLMTTMSLALGYEGLLPLPLVVLVVGRDALLVAGSLVYRARTKRPQDAFFDVASLDYKIKPSLLSKYNTALQFSALWLALTHAVYLVPGDVAFTGICYATGLATVTSGAAYLVASGMKPTSRIRQRLSSHEERLEQRLALQEERVKERGKKIRALTKEQLELQREKGRMVRARLLKRHTKGDTGGRTPPSAGFHGVSVRW